MKQRIITLFAMLVLTAATAMAQHAPDFAEKFVTLCKGDSLVSCVTVSPKMMGQLVDRLTETPEGDIAQAISKLRSMRIVTATADHYEKAETLLRNNARRFKAQQDFQTETMRGAFYTRQNRKGQTVELIMLREDIQQKKLTIICLTGDIDKEFLCFLYNNKSFKN